MDSSSWQPDNEQGGGGGGSCTGGGGGTPKIDLAAAGARTYARFSFSTKEGGEIGAHRGGANGGVRTPTSRSRENQARKSLVTVEACALRALAFDLGGQSRVARIGGTAPAGSSYGVELLPDPRPNIVVLGVGGRIGVFPSSNDDHERNNIRGASS